MSKGSTGPGDPVLRQLLALAQRALQQKDLAAAEQLFGSVLASDPAEPNALNFMVLRALETGAPQRALDYAERALRHAPSPLSHFLQGRALEALPDRQGAYAAFVRASELDPHWLPALLWQAAQEEALGMHDRSVATSLRALHVAERAGMLADPARLPTEIRNRISHAFAVTDRQRELEIERALAPVRERHGAGSFERIEHALEASAGRREVRWPHPLQRPTFLLIPGLEPRPWFEREEFPFLAEIERHTDAIREELLEVLADEARLTPYIDMAPDAPAAAVWEELNRSARWSSYHLHRHGERMEEHCRRCPRTAAALAALPLMEIPEHSPEALFSILRAGTHIPPHTGVINGRLTVHLPLIVPKDCGALKAGGEARGWEEGRCLVFDDSFMHEAWNSSTQDRAVLIFDIWDPRLSQAEREALSASIAAFGRFNRAYGERDTTLGSH